MDRSPPRPSPLASFDAADWIAAVSHDLRDPMNAIVGMTRLLLASPLDAEQRGFAETIEDAADGMLTLLNDLLDVERLQRGDIVVRHDAFDLVRLARGSLELVSARRQSDDVALGLEIAEGVPGWVVGDAGRLRQVLVNLLGNALKFTPAGSVRLKIERDGDDRLRFTVSDTGPGIPAAQHDRIFEPFVRLGGEGKAGLGLGLAIVRLVVDRLGGRLDLASAEGRGSSFFVVLPLAAAAKAAPAPRVAVRGGCVWFVDAPSPLRARCTAMLQALGLTVDLFTAPADASARAQLGLDLPDAVLVATAGLDDAVRDLVAALGGQASGTALLALVTSGLRGDAEAWRQAGFHGYLPYPASADLLGDALSVLLAAPAERTFLTTHSLAERQGAGRDVLVVDDNPMNLRLAAILLERAGHRVTEARDGDAAWRAVAAGGVDAVLMDVQMPVMDGLEATRRIRRLADAAAGTPVIAVTANASPAEVAACLAAGMDDVVTKPIDPTALLAALAARPKPVA